jgi:uncharacterized protein YeeX (DUF496 family)
MMVARSPYVENPKQLIKDLDQAVIKLAEISKKKQAISNQEMTDLISVLHKFNVTLDTGFWEDKRLAPEEMKSSIENALLAITLFNLNQPIKEKGTQKNVDQAIISLFATLAKEVNDFDKNLKNLKEIKIGRKVEKTSESKHS